MKSSKLGYKIVKTIFQQYEEIPNDWDFEKISDIGEIVGGGTPDTTNEEYWIDGNISWFTPQELTDLKTNFVKDSERKITQKGLNESSAKIVPEGTILVTTRATIGNIAISQGSVCTNQGFQNIICNNNCDNNFLMYSLKYNKRRLRQFSQGTTFLEISKNNLAKIKIPIPKNPDEGKKIGVYLSNIDSLIQKQEEIIEQCKVLKQGLIHKLLTKGIEKVEPKKEVLNFRRTIEISKKWKVSALDDIKLNEQHSFVDGPFGSCLKTSDFTEYGIPIIQLNNIGIGEFLANEMNFTSQEKFEELERAAIFPGDIVIAKMADPVARCCIVPRLYEKYLISADCIKLKVDKQRFSTKFVQYMINSPWVMNMARSFATGTTRLRINLSDLKKVRIPHAPEKDEQEKIALILSNIDSLIIQEEKFKKKIQKIRRGLMQQLLTGQKRVKV